jgi:hypothetical protein
MKFQAFLNEASMPSKSNVVDKITNGLDNNKYAKKVADMLYNYFDESKLKKSDKPYIYKSQSSPKLIDELWYRNGAGLGTKNLMNKDELAKLKENFYSFAEALNKIFKWDAKEQRWNYIG